MSSIRIILLCSSRLALPSLRQLLFLNVLAVVVVPFHCDEMAEHVQYILKESNVPVITVDKGSYAKEIATAVKTHDVSMGLMITFSFRLPSHIFTLTSQGFYNVHPGPLPHYRGADPIFQQIKNREKQAGVTIHQLDQNFDTGPVVMQEMIRLQPTDTYGLLTSKLGQVAARKILVLLKLISFGLPVPQKPQDETKSRYFKKHLAKDVSIDWYKMDDLTIIALVNACNPWNKGATTRLNGQIVRLLEAEALSTYELPAHTPPATIMAFNEKKMVVSTMNSRAISIGFVYMDEGFLGADRLPGLGILPGFKFDTSLL